MKNGISLIINTKNEEKNIRECIQSVKEIADEVIIVDMQSTDKTRQIARKMGAKVYSIKDYGYVEPARNFALNKAKYVWILLLDADERLNSHLAKVLKKIQTQDLYDVIFIPYKNILLGKWIKHTGWWPDYHPRFFKKGYLTWKEEVHSEPSIRGRLTHLTPIEKYAITHYNVSTIDQLMNKAIRYTKVSNSFAMEEATFAQVIGHYEREFNFRFIEKEGYKDGVHGFMLSKFMELYRFLEVMRSWEKSGFKSTISSKEIFNTYEASHPTNILIQRLQNDLNKIQSAKFYKIWQTYCNLRDKILKR